MTAVLSDKNSQGDPQPFSGGLCVTLHVPARNHHGWALFCILGAREGQICNTESSSLPYGFLTLMLTPDGIWQDGSVFFPSPFEAVSLLHTAPPDRIFTCLAWLHCWVAKITYFSICLIDVRWHDLQMFVIPVLFSVLLSRHLTKILLIYHFFLKWTYHAI